MAGLTGWSLRAFPLLDRIRTINVPTLKGTLPIGGDLPNSSMVDEFTNGALSDPAIAGHAFDLASVVEVSGELSTQVIVQSAEDILDAVQESHRLAIAERLLEQVLTGTGQNNQLSSVLSAAGIGSDTYAAADRGNGSAFVKGESTIEDNGGTPSAWAFGADLSDSARSTLLEPGSDRRTEEQGRLMLSGTQAFRNADLTGTTGVCADWRRSVVLVVQDEMEYVLNGISKPGTLRITSRLPVDLLVVRPKLVYRLEQV